MPFVNSYKPPTAPSPDANRTTSAEEYDFNYFFEPKVLKSDRVELRPFVPSLHAQSLADLLIANPDISTFLPFNIKSLDDILVWVEKNRQDPTFLQHAIYSAPPGPDAANVPVEQYVFAGTISFINSSIADSQSELGWIIIAPEFQKRTHVLTHAAGLGMHRILDDEEEGGLALRRCQWYTNSLHVKSQGAAKRLGFTQEGLLRAHRVLLPGKPGARAGRKGEREECPSRDSWLASVTWEEWESGVREHVDGLMARKA